MTGAKMKNRFSTLNFEPETLNLFSEPTTYNHETALSACQQQIKQFEKKHLLMMGNGVVIPLYW